MKLEQNMMNLRNNLKSLTEAEKSYSGEEEEVGHMDISNILIARSTEEPHIKILRQSNS